MHCYSRSIREKLFLAHRMADRFNLRGSKVFIGNAQSNFSNVYTFDTTTNGALSLENDTNPQNTTLNVKGNISCDAVVISNTDVTEAIRNVHSSTLRLYVKTTGNDAYDGLSYGKAFRTIKHAASVAATMVQQGGNNGNGGSGSGSGSKGVVIYVEAGDYSEDNPILLEQRVSVMGDNLRETRIFPQRPQCHLFFVKNLCYLWGMRFMNLRQPAFCVAFPCSIAEVEIQFQRIVACHILYSFEGYTSPPEIRIEAPETSTGNAPTVIATINSAGEIDTLEIDENSRGDLYPATSFVNIPFVTISRPDIEPIAPGLQAVVVGNSIDKINITSPGSKYLTKPDITIQEPTSGTGIQATAEAILDGDGYLVDVQITGAGSGYFTDRTYTVTIDDPLPIPAAAEVSMEIVQGTEYARVSGIRLTESGGGYGTVQVQIDPPPSIQATAIAEITNGVISNITVTNPGSGYTNMVSRPYVSIDPPDDQKVLVTASPYIQNCSSITGPFRRSDGTKVVKPLPYIEDEQDVDKTGAGGGCVIDGAVVSPESPLRSMCADSFTLVNEGGAGHLVINTGYGQFVSCFTTFCSYSYRAAGGGRMNVSTSVSDFGTYGLVSSGYWPERVATGKVFEDYRSNVASVIVTNPGVGYDASTTVIFSDDGSDIDATATVSVVDNKIASVNLTSNGSYTKVPRVTFEGTGAGATATAVMERPSQIRVTDMSGSTRKPELGTVVWYKNQWHTVIRSTSVPEHLGEYYIVFDPPMVSADTNDQLEFVAASVVSTGQHVMEYVGAGVTKNALPEYGGTSEQANYIVQQTPARVFYSITDHLGNQQVGPYFSVEQLSGEITLNSDRFSLSGLEAIGPFKRDGVAVGERLEEVSNDTRLLDSTGKSGGTTVPTQYAVSEYVKNNIGTLDPPTLVQFDQTSFVSSTPVVSLSLDKGTYYIQAQYTCTVTFDGPPGSDAYVSSTYAVTSGTIDQEFKSYNVSTSTSLHNTFLETGDDRLWCLESTDEQTVRVQATLVVTATSAATLTYTLGPGPVALSDGAVTSGVLVSTRTATT